MNNNENFSPSTKEEDKSSVMKKLGNVGGIFKTTSLENEDVKPPKNNYLDGDFKNNYNNHTHSHNDNNHRQERDTNKKVNKPASDFDDIQKPTFSNSNLKENSSNFVDISLENDVNNFFNLKVIL